jgi:hypothetical protein
MSTEDDVISELKEGNHMSIEDDIISEMKETTEERSSKEQSRL